MADPLSRLDNPRRTVTVFEDDLKKVCTVAWAATRLRAGHIPKDIAEQELDAAIRRLRKDGD